MAAWRFHACGLRPTLDEYRICDSVSRVFRVLVAELQFGGEEEEKIRRAVATFCSNQPSALELIKSKKKKDPRFTLFMQVAAAAAGATRFAPRSAPPPPGSELVALFSGGREQPAVPAPAAEGHHPGGNAASHQVPDSPGQDCQVHG